MKYILTFITILILSTLAYFGYRHFWVTSSISVQENITDWDGVYSWEQWCHYTHPDDSTTKQLIGTFKVTGDFKSHGPLETNVCAKRYPLGIVI